MYPTIQPSGFANPPRASSSSYAAPHSHQHSGGGSAYGATQGNGPSTAGSDSGAAGYNFPLLRVHIADPYRTHPPVMIGPGMDDIERAQFSFDFDLERRLTSDSSRSQSNYAAQASTSQITDPFSRILQHFVEQGLSREEVTLALAAQKGRLEGQDVQVADFCKAFKALKSMGFPPDVIAGALIVHANDLQAATDACLAGH